MYKRIQQYGTWDSPITSRALAAKLRLLDAKWDSDGETLVWLEGRGKQGVLLAQRGGQAPVELTGDLSVRGGVNYGGGEYTVFNGRVFFAASDGRLYRQSLDEGPARPLTPAFGGLASPAVSPDGRWLVYVHSDGKADGLALVDTEGELWPRKLAFRADFYMQPTWHPSGTRLAYVAWNFPNMPWDGSELRLATLEADTAGVPYVASMQTIAGDANTAILQPEFSPDGRMLAYVSDASGWGQVILYDLADGTHTRLTDIPAEHGTPAWQQDTRVLAWSADSRSLYTLRNEQGFVSLWQIDVQRRTAHKVEGLDDYTLLSQLSVSSQGELALIASAGTIPDRVITLQPQRHDVPPVLSLHPDAPQGIAVIVDEGQGVVVRRRSSGERIPREALASPEAVEWTSFDGESAYGLYYPPTNPAFEGVGLPPLIVYVHGGPTSQARAGYSPTAQFFATRGFAFLEVNHRGSTGYGRAYQDKLRGMWGVYDVEDSASGAQALAARGLADPQKLVIMGGSAGGYTVLQSLVNKPGVYSAGLCYYGVADLFALTLASDFKFESRYNDQLIGPLPQESARYRERSPLFHADRIRDPLIIFQGTDDKVVTPAHSEGIVAALRSHRIPHEYVVFEGEGHGWRKPETIETFYNRLMDFLKRNVLFA
jgi:dipeptidyl aminopeptidase/acylaminoacyl peptidase